MIIESGICWQLLTLRCLNLWTCCYSNTCLVYFAIRSLRIRSTVPTIFLSCNKHAQCVNHRHIALNVSVCLCVCLHVCTATQTRNQKEGRQGTYDVQSHKRPRQYQASNRNAPAKMPNHRRTAVEASYTTHRTNVGLRQNSFFSSVKRLWNTIPSDAPANASSNANWETGIRPCKLNYNLLQN